MDSHAAIVEDWRGKWGWIKTYTYGGMSIHLPPILVFTRGVLTRNHITFPKTLRRTGSYGSWSVWKSSAVMKPWRLWFFWFISFSTGTETDTTATEMKPCNCQSEESEDVVVEIHQSLNRIKRWGWIKIDSLWNMKKIPSPWYEDESLVNPWWIPHHQREIGPQDPWWWQISAGRTWRGPRGRANGWCSLAQGPGHLDHALGCWERWFSTLLVVIILVWLFFKSIFYKHVQNREQANF